LIIQGARQVGNTWLMKAFGSLHFENVVYVNFESSIRLQKIFTTDFDIPRIIQILEIETGKSIVAKNTLIILDEIQEAEKGLTALKYFYENISYKIRNNISNIYYRPIKGYSEYDLWNFNYYLAEIISKGLIELSEVEPEPQFSSLSRI
jgi:hypothetical protein